MDLETAVRQITESRKKEVRKLTKNESNQDWRGYVKSFQEKTDSVR